MSRRSHTDSTAVTGRAGQALQGKHVLRHRVDGRRITSVNGALEEKSNKGMNLTRVGAGAERSRRGVASWMVAVQVMPGVRRTC